MTEDIESSIAANSGLDQKYNFGTHQNRYASDPVLLCWQEPAKMKIAILRLSAAAKNRLPDARQCL